MDSLNCLPQEFHFIYQSSEEFQFQHSIRLPLDTNVTPREYGFLLMKQYHIPEYFEDDLMEKLQSFIDEHIDKIQCNRIEHVLKNRQKLASKSQQFIEKLKICPTLPDAKLHNQNLQKSKDNISDENFYSMYHKIIHSGKLTQQLIQLENHNSEVIRSFINQKEEFLRGLSEDQSKKIEDILLSGKYSEKEINTLTKENVALAQKIRNEWLEKICNIRSNQKREFYTWIKNIYEDLMKDSSSQAIANAKTNPLDLKHDSPPNISNEDKENSFSDFVDISDEFEMQESYTINLGSQLKTTHNLRLIAANMLKFCSNVLTAHRIQTAMSLYSNSLSAVVLLADESLTSSATTKSDFAKMIMNSSENHFPGLDFQFDLIKAELNRLKPVNEHNQKNGQNYRLKAGDVYITRHSNLSEAHVVFHIVTDDTIRHSEINSRHPVILGLRNILKIAYIYDISNIYLPLLLLDQMYEDITIQWCLKRAELILKCVKGFMIEMSSLLSISDSENKTIQFVVPKGISQELFTALSSIFPTVFRLSNPLFLTKNDNM
ncbi:FERRY endosomal RAB5 effector complex subunit 3 [Dermatophagoides pteronyssinus]|uniref:Protein C12orf4 homolog n=1 Tax=Dermatophagoides pteronyssinus TaxID=6956 RepID=A0A6P6Y704_DERPT|nr:protein C12orf4 homolog [Dermatophagoides pteronyssinus]